MNAALQLTPDSADIVAAVLGELLIPILTDAEGSLAREVIAACATRFGSIMATESARYLSQAISVFAFPHTRSGWLGSLQDGGRQAGLDLTPYISSAAAVNPEAGNKLKLKDGSLLTDQEITVRITSMQDIIALVDQEADDGYFSWDKLITQIAANLDQAAIEVLRQFFRGRRHGAQVFAILSRRLVALGMSREAWQLAQEALAQSSERGWSRSYDGGSRLDAFQALSYINPSATYKLAFETLSRDLVSEYWYPRTIALNLMEILPLLVEHVPVLSIWQEIELYLRGLMLPYENSRAAPWTDDIECPPATASEALAAWLLGYQHHSVSLIQETAQRACGNLLLKHNQEMINALRSLLLNAGEDQPYLLMVLDAVSLQDQSILENFRDELYQLFASPNYATRQISQALAARIGIVAPPPSTLSQLPPIYQIDLPEGSPLRDTFALPQWGEPLPDTTDTRELLQLWDPELQAIAAGARIPVERLRFRAVQIMRSLAEPAMWATEGERKLRDQLDRMGLEFAYRRPRAEISRQAIFHVVAELVDAGRLSSAGIRRLDQAFRFYDPQLVLTKPIARPNVIVPISGEREHGSHEEEWVQQVGQSVDHIALNHENYIVLGEDSTLIHLDWGKPTELRKQVVRPPTGNRVIGLSEVDGFFERIVRRIVSDYPRAQLDGDGSWPVVVQHASYGYDTPAEKWLALNPVLGRQLGWTVASEGLFRWTDSAGQTMVESLWWADGLIEHRPPHFDDEVGEGWLVIATQAALQVIMRKLGTLYRHVIVQRNFHHDERGDSSQIARRVVPVEPQA